MATNFKPKPTPKPLIKKPRLTPAEIERKRTKPAGYCAVAFEDQKRVLKNKATRKENRLGRDGFKRKGLVMDMFASPEGIAAMAAVLIGLNVMGGAIRGIIGGIAGLIFGGGKIGGKAARILRDNSGNGPSGAPAAPAAAPGRSRKPKHAMGGSGGEDTGTAPVSSRRRDTSTAAAPVPVQAPLSKRERSSQAGDRIRDRAGIELGDRLAYDFLIAAVVFKPGHTGGDPREAPGAFDRLKKLSPAVAAFLTGTHPGSTEYVRLRRQMEQVAIRIAGTTSAADKAHLGSEFLPEIDAHAKAWMLEQEAAFQAGGPRPEAENENEGGARAARPGMANGPDEPPTNDLPTPFGRK